MEPISAITICLETANDVEYVKGEDGVNSLKYNKTASGIELEITGTADEIQGWPWGSIQSYVITR